MNFNDLKGLFKKKKPATEERRGRRGDDQHDQRRSNEKIIGGRRKGEGANPYISARRTWNEHVGSVVAQRNTWQVIGVIALLISLAAVGGMIHIGSQAKFIPYVVEVDKTGRVFAGGPVTAGHRADQRIVKAAIAEFITDIRLVSFDVSLQRRAVFKVYAKLSGSDPAMGKANEWLNGSKDSNPFIRAKTEIVSTEIESILQQTDNTWEIEWIETSRDRGGVLRSPPTRWRAFVTVYVAEPSPSTTEEQLLMNPMNIFVRDFNWTRIN